MISLYRLKDPFTDECDRVYALAHDEGETALYQEVWVSRKLPIKPVSRFRKDELIEITDALNLK